MNSFFKEPFFRGIFRKSAVILLLLLNSFVFSQTCYNPFVDSVISKVSLESICMLNRVLTGDTSAIIGGQPYTIISRYWESPSNHKAAQYIHEKFISYGLNSHYMNYSPTGTNVIAVKPGTKYPNQKIIICAHYDNITYSAVPDTTHGADDNASGTCAVLEAARILSGYSFDFTIVFAAWDEEERGFFGSEAYADSCYRISDSIITVINLDMIGFDRNNDGMFNIASDTNSLFYANMMKTAANVFTPFLKPVHTFSYGGSDQVPFIRKGFKAFETIESYQDFNIYYHTVEDNYQHLNTGFFLNMTKAAIACLVTILKDYVIEIKHDPLPSTFEISSRVAKVVLKSRHQIVKSPSSNPLRAARLYYKTGEGTFSYLYAYEVRGDTLNFLLPAQPRGTKVSYYIAVQDSLGEIIGSLPAGARGVNPPGLTPPLELYTYYILSNDYQCSQGLPKPLPPKVIINDSIYLQQAGIITDININLSINHQNDSDLYIQLRRPGVSLIQLSTQNGGTGDNYINTTFDDEAEISITNANAPFTGSFRPENQLSFYDNTELKGTWNLRILNNSFTLSGELVSWCISFSFINPISTGTNNLPVKMSLEQNYPNPFNSSTSITFFLKNKARIKIVLYDVTGREVQTLVNETFEQGNYTTAFNANNLASGLYFYSMYIDGSLFDTKKMVLLK
jgi:subtilisin-like proprotein convertase family protein